MNLNRKKEQGENLQVNDTFYTKIIKENLNLKFSFDVFFLLVLKIYQFLIFILHPTKRAKYFQRVKSGRARFEGSLSHLTTLQKLSQLSKWTATSSLV